MNTLKYNFNCLDGYYKLVASFDESKVEYSVETSIEYLEDCTGELEAKEFIEILSKANLKTWEKEYLATGSSIEDETSWYLEYVEDGNTYASKGVESYEPYNYEYLIDALCLLDKKPVNLLKNRE